jgi:hypothetical protein
LSAKKLATSGWQLTFYQDDFETPGISPRKASCRKHSRHSPNFRRNARGRPQILQRLCLRVENLGFFTFCGLVLLSVPSFTRFAVVAKFAPNHFLQSPDLVKLITGIASYQDIALTTPQRTASYQDIALATPQRNASYQGIALAMPQPRRQNRPFRGCAPHALNGIPKCFNSDRA